MLIFGLPPTVDAIKYTKTKVAKTPKNIKKKPIKKEIVDDDSDCSTDLHYRDLTEDELSKIDVCIKDKIGRHFHEYYIF